MADETTSSAPKGAEGNTATSGDHDRVSMLSLRADGTPAQLNPELIGDPDYVLEATKRQFREQAVSAVDAAERPTAFGGAADEVPQDPTIEALKKKHDDAAKAAEKAAEAAVKGLTA